MSKNAPSRHITGFRYLISSFLKKIQTFRCSQKLATMSGAFGINKTFQPKAAFADPFSARLTISRMAFGRIDSGYAFLADVGVAYEWNDSATVA